MIDKKHDSFFDEVSTGPSDQEKLLSMLDATTQKSIRSFKRGDKVKGPIISIGQDYAFVDIGAKHEASMKLIELADAEGVLTVDTGDTIEAFFISDVNGEILISRSLSGGSGSITQLVDAKNQQLPIEGKVTGVGKAGLQVKIMGQRAFCPISQIEISRVEDVNVYLNRTMDFVITEVTEGGRNIICSRMPILEKTLDKEIDGLAEKIAAKAVYTGVITRIMAFGLFVKIGNLEGLVHISEISWDRTEKLEGLYTIGQTVQVQILSVERKEPLRDSKISLSIKQALKDPWIDINLTCPIGAAINGTVTRLADFGAFVRILPGVEGLVHVSEMSWGKRINHPKDVVQVGQEIRVTVLSINTDKKTVSLTLKDVDADPWKEIPTKFPVGSTASGTIASQKPYGYFIDLTENVTGLLAMPNIAPEKKADLKVGSKIDVRIDNIDTDLRRLSLSYGLVEAAQDDREMQDFMQKQNAPVVAQEPDSPFAAAFKLAMDKKGAPQTPRRGA